MVPYKHQIEISQKAYKILKENALVYLAMLERTGKTLTAILTCELSPYITKVLVITKKQAIAGWNETIDSYKPKQKYVVTNYESCHKVLDSDFGIVILDEAHNNISGFPKLPKIWKNVYNHTKGKPTIFLSATPSAQGSSLLFHQLKLNDWSPFSRDKNFYSWFAKYGIPRTQHTANGVVKKYDRCKEDLVQSKVKHLFITYTRQDLGFEYEPEDIIHYVELDESTKKLYRDLEKRGLIFVNNQEIIADTPTSLLTKLHQIEGGTIKSDGIGINLNNTEKIDYILNTWGDTEDLVIMYHYIQEEHKLKQYFKKAKILQGIRYAEGVDLSMYEHLVIYSMDFRTAKYTQRRARQANMKRTTEIKVHFILTKKGISEQVYNTVAINKKNFVDSYFERGLL